jgi:NhaP-type Na+/H+ or K+/H+ antiporter
LIDNSIILAGLIVSGVACQWLSWFTRIPAILFLLFLGIAVGPVFGVLHAETLLGESFFPFISLGVAVILFEGSLSLNLREIQHIGKVIRNLVTIGCVVTAVLSCLLAGLLTDIPWGLAAVFGAIMTVSGPAVITPMLRTIRPTPRVGRILKWEGILIDPIGATLTVLVYEFIQSYYGGHSDFGAVALVFLKICGIGILSGFTFGYGYGWLLKRHLIPEFIQNTTSLGLVFLVFAGSNAIEHESGLLSVTVMGLVLGNMRGVDLRMMLHFKESLSMLLISSLFILLASRLDLNAFLELGWRGALLLILIQFVIRPLTVWLCTLKADLNKGEKVLLSWITPRGVVAAAVSSLIALRLEELGMHQAPMLVSLTFLVIIGTVTFECLTARTVAKKFDAMEPESRGILIAGANPVARAVAEVLKKNNFRVLLGDDSRAEVKEAQMAGLDSYYGNLISEHANTNLDLIGYGRFFALTPEREVNHLACTHFALEFGKAHVYCVSTESKKIKTSQKRDVLHHYRGFTLFGEKITYAKLASLLASGAKFRSTKLSDGFTLEDLQEEHQGVLLLFAISPKGDLQIFVDKGSMKPLSGWTIISLVQSPDEAEATKMEIVD